MHVRIGPLSVCMRGYDLCECVCMFVCVCVCACVCACVCTCAISMIRDLHIRVCVGVYIGACVGVYDENESIYAYILCLFV